jgi:peptidoglycan/xylan/chitin deacetylase (PgdA/CDA1 family)
LGRIPSSRRLGEDQPALRTGGRAPWTSPIGLVIVVTLMRRSSKTRLHARRSSRNRRNRRFGYATFSFLILLALGLALLGYGCSFPSEEAEQSRGVEQSRPEPPMAPEPDRGVDEAWTTAVAQDASPTLATPGETMAFDHRIALTFDDGPDPVTTPAILDVLRDYHIKATFFVIGARAEQHPDLIERMVSEGHALGNHTYYHRDLTKMAPESMQRELQETQAAIDRALGRHYRITLFRPPCGAPYNTEIEKLPAFQEAMREQQMYPVMWTIDPRDWALGEQPESIIANLSQGTPEAGGVVLLHDTQPQTAEALPKILDHYAAAGFEFTGVRDLLAGKYLVDPKGIDAAPGTRQPGSSPPPEGSGDNYPGDLAALSECLT